MCYKYLQFWIYLVKGRLSLLPTFCRPSQPAESLQGRRAGQSDHQQHQREEGHHPSGQAGPEHHEASQAGADQRRMSLILYITQNVLC